MQSPQLVANCVGAMKTVVALPVTVKCRLGVDDQDIETALDAVVDCCLDEGVDAIWVHARKAWLEGLSPKENRDIPPLDYDRVYRLKQRLGNVFIGINGGITSLDEAEHHLQHVDGVMIGRAAYHQPALLRDVDQRFYGAEEEPEDLHEIVRKMYPIIKAHLRAGGRLHQITRHMIGLFHGAPGARRYRQILSTQAVKAGAGTQVVEAALEALTAEQQTLRQANELSVPV
jgi:tRNA-dihydrouridine synthase A